LIIQAVVVMLSGAGVEVFDDVICFSLEQMMVTVFSEEVLYF